MLIPETVFGAELHHPWEAGLIFALTFTLISFRRMRILPIGRPAGAMPGAVLMVVSGVMTPTEAYARINWDTIALHRREPREILGRIEGPLLLFFAGLFVVIGGLEVSGLAQHLTGASLQMISG